MKTNRFWTVTLNRSEVSVNKDVNGYLHAKTYQEVTPSSRRRIVRLSKLADVNTYRNRPYLIIGS